MLEPAASAQDAGQEVLGLLANGKLDIEGRLVDASNATAAAFMVTAH